MTIMDTGYSLPPYFTQCNHFSLHKYNFYQPAFTTNQQVVHLYFKRHTIKSGETEGKEAETIENPAVFTSLPFFIDCSTAHQHLIQLHVLSAVFD